MNRLAGKNVYLIGFMATGKSQVGRELSKLLHWPFLDTDQLVEKSAGVSIDDIFSLQGEVAFRELESRVIAAVSQRHHCVVSLGGGAVINSQNWQTLSQSGISICLTASLQTIIHRVQRKSDRPLLKNLSDESLQQKIQTMLDHRLPHYQQADYHFESQEEVSARELAKKIYIRILES